MSPRTSSCVYCGAAPAPHSLLFIESTIDILTSRILFPIVSPFVGLLFTPASFIVDSLGSLTASILSTFGLLTYTSDTSLAASSRTKAVWKEAEHRGISMQTAILGGRSLELSRACVPNKNGKKSWHYFQSLPIPPWKDSYSAPTIDDKAVLKQLFEKNNLPIPRGGTALSSSGALSRFRALSGPVIVKPQDGSRARHTTVDITDENELVLAFKRAQQLCLFVMVEEFIPGTLYRATCVDGKLIGVIAFIKPSIIADGVQTAEELRTAHNAKKKFPHLTDVEDNAWFTDALAHQGFTKESIPPEGTRLLLSEHSERENGGYFIDCTDSVPQGTVETIEKAARVCEAHVVGFDIISESLEDVHKRFVFIEANTLPFIEIHSIPYEGTPRNVAGALWDSWS